MNTTATLTRLVRLWYRIPPSKRWVDVGVYEEGEEIRRAEREHVPREAEVRYRFDPPEETNLFNTNSEDQSWLLGEQVAAAETPAA